MVGKLIVVGTPIGNLGDMSDRMKETLSMVDFIAAEDTRVTVKLLNHLEIKKPMISYFEHNKNQKGEYICNRIMRGETCALVSDAGMPAISDPGQELVSQCAERGIEVTVIPGPCAFVSALAISGLNSGRFTFEGFLSVTKKNRFAHLNSLKHEERTIIFYEAPHKFLRTIKDLFEVLGERRIAIVRELTKVHEEVIRTTLSAAIERYTKSPIKGEIVLIIEGYISDKKEQYTLNEAVCIASGLIEKGYTILEASKMVAKDTGIRKSDIYKGLTEI